ncbi:hypothetical protein THAOC_22357 [Thalassiosira oceanica]|uniref:Uncharacterized protein n=1 Tax=Thalassiosira oceanica TaxID=159749 RepID=K0RXA3_THAOC|nr:hypothetical protein THAOC_22357 [Thalassiosira oceanica]|eukprot:EJK57585.1 hypothetical protein THAOC_22357 [Thalassiosira oceanica]
MTGTMLFWGLFEVPITILKSPALRQAENGKVWVRQIGYGPLVQPLNDDRHQSAGAATMAPMSPLKHRGREVKDSWESWPLIMGGKNAAKKYRSTKAGNINALLVERDALGQVRYDADKTDRTMGTRR